MAYEELRKDWLPRVRGGCAASSGLRGLRLTWYLLAVTGTEVRDVMAQAGRAQVAPMSTCQEAAIS